MYRTTWAVVAGVLALSGAASGQDGERFVERTPPRHIPPHNTQQRAGYPYHLAPWAVPGVSRYEAGGYVGGERLTHNSALTKGHGVVTGPTRDGTFGWDFAGFHIRPGRVFLRSSDDPSRGRNYARGYRTDGPRVPDPLALRPLRKALLEAQEEREHEEHGEEGGH